MENRNTHPDDVESNAYERLITVAKLMQAAGQTKAADEMLTSSDLRALGGMVRELAQSAHAAYEATGR